MFEEGVASTSLYTSLLRHTRNAERTPHPVRFAIPLWQAKEGMFALAPLLLEARHHRFECTTSKKGGPP